MESSQIDFDAFVGQMRNLLQAEDSSLFTQGDMLRAQGLDAAGMRKLADQLNRKVGTLRDRERISREFNDCSEIPRVTGVPWTAYLELSRIADPGLRLKVWETRKPSDWTLGAMKEAVYKALPKSSAGNRLTRTFTFQGYKLVLESTGNGLAITTESPREIADDVTAYALDERKHYVRYVNA